MSRFRKVMPQADPMQTVQPLFALFDRVHVGCHPEADTTYTGWEAWHDRAAALRVAVREEDREWVCEAIRVLRPFADSVARVECVEKRDCIHYPKDIEKFERM